MQKLIYMTIYDNLVKMFRKISQERKKVGIFCILKKVWGVRVCNISENLKTCENGEVMSPFTLYRKFK